MVNGNWEEEGGEVGWEGMEDAKRRELGGRRKFQHVACYNEGTKSNELRGEGRGRRRW